MSSSIEALQYAVRNEALPLPERKQAAGLLVDALVDAVAEPAENDADVIALITPPPADTSIGDLLTRAWAIGNQTRGWPRTGGTLGQVRRHVREKRRTALTTEIYSDKTRHGLEREAAAQRLLDGLPPGSMMRRNGVTAQRLIAEAS